jgi:hypothetical protein
MLRAFTVTPDWDAILFFDADNKVDRWLSIEEMTIAATPKAKLEALRQEMAAKFEEDQEAGYAQVALIASLRRRRRIA